MSKRVVVGLSGGVDSAVTARLLTDAGYEVHGLYLSIGAPGGVNDAREIADFLGVPLDVLDVRAEMESLVIAPFICAYLRGETPNPCVLCNPAVKFSALLRHADKLGARYAATGHYARVTHGEAGVRLMKGAPSNDQSYMLCRLTLAQLDRVLLPLGGYAKSEVRALAAGCGLTVASKPDSMEICFIPDGDYAAYIESRTATPPPGNFVDTGGSVLGRHGGLHRYTVGQRRGLGISASNRLYVKEIRPDTNEVVLCSEGELRQTGLRVVNMNWLAPPVSSEPFHASVKVRHSRGESPALITPDGDGAAVTFTAAPPKPAAVKGQSAVIYQGDVVVGGGFIAN